MLHQIKAQQFYTKLGLYQQFYTDLGLFKRW